MSEAHVVGNEVLAANRALREWAAALRYWSRAARHSSVMQREHAGALKGSGRAGYLVEEPGASGYDECVEDGLILLDDVLRSELFTLLVEHHAFSTSEAERALALGLLIAGYPSDFPEILAADAFDIVESALRHRR